MDAPTSHSGLEEFFESLARSDRGVLVLDYDGTLSPFALDTQAARPYPGVPALLDAIMASGRTRLVVVTGRALQSAPPPLGTRQPPEIWGSHGRERLLPDGSYSIVPIEDPALRALIVADDWAAGVIAAGGRCESKPGCIAFHWRGTSSDQELRIRNLVAENFRAAALDRVLEWRVFDGGIELRAPGPGKGDVMRTLLAETDPGTPVAYLGDDFTDEDAFEVLRGRGIGVLVRPQFRPTAAGFWLQPPAGLLDFLERWHRAGAAAP